ncbi:hypothetical protein BHM03_00021213 [Ensete ventricosum]|nr:hypothetical protein BHM03_00021213 [Ensete ventricosum]
MRPCQVGWVAQRLKELYKAHRGVEADGQKGRRSDSKSKGTQLPKSYVLVIMEVDSEECHSAIEANLPITKKETRMQGNG